MPTPKRRAGRLTRVEAARRAERVVEVAANMFLERGFDATSMEAVAEKAGIAKPTLYAWYRDKAELFTAVLRRQIEHFLGPLGRRAARSGGDRRRECFNGDRPARDRGGLEPRRSCSETNRHRAGRAISRA